jgi:phosphate transport system permease protein
LATFSRRNIVKFTNPPPIESPDVDAINIQPIIARSKLYESVFTAIGIATMALAMGVLVILLVKLFTDGVPKLNWNFFTSFPSSRALRAGILPAWVGSGLVMLVTTAVAVPLGMAAAVYLEEYAKKNWLSDLIEINVTNLAGVPSIIYGLLGLGLFKYGLHLGQSVATAGLTLALLVLPVTIVSTREGIRSIPGNIREAAYAVGATKWQVIWDHILPYSTGTTLTGVIVAISRAFGETAPLITIGALTYVSSLPDSPLQGTFPFVSFNWLLSSFTVLPIQMFDWVQRPDPRFQENAAAAGITIVTMTLVMNSFAIYLRYRLRKSIKW